MYNQTIDVINNRDIDGVFFSITVISQEIKFNDGNGYIYSRDVNILLGCNIHGIRKYITSIFSDDFPNTSDWYNLLLKLKGKGLKHVFFISTDNEMVIKAFKLAFPGVENHYYIFNCISNLSKYLSCSYSDNLLGKIRDICCSIDNNQFNLKKEVLYNDYSNSPFIIDLFNNMFNNYTSFLNYPIIIRKHLISIYFIRDIKKKLNSISKSKYYFTNIDEFIKPFIPTLCIFETRMYCGHKEWNEIISFLYIKNKDLLLSEL